MDRPLNLPEGYAARQLTPGDAQAVTDLIAATELDVDGMAEIDVSDIRGDWDRPSFDLETMAVGVEHRGSLVAAGEVFMGRADVDVHPTHRGRGIGTAMMGWTHDVTRREGRDEVGQTVSDVHATAIALFRANGYAPKHTSWVLRIDVDDDLPESSLPDGLAIRDWIPGSDDRALFELIDTAFNEWDDREGHAFQDWHAATLAHVAVSPATTPLVVDGGRIVGAAVGMDYGDAAEEGWVQQLAVDAGYRGRGLGRALLTESFRRFRATGRDRVGLSTDSRTGALSLYEHVGMRVDRSYTRWSNSLD
jgi:mycothiol synthase